MMDFDVGDRLRAVRNASGLSQRQLAERAGVPHGQISMVETNRCSPSIASLRKILDGMGLSMAEFFEPERPRDTKVFFKCGDLQDLTALLSPDHRAQLSFRQVGDARANNLQILHERYEPGADTGETMLSHEANEGGIVVSGAIEITVGKTTKTLHAGDAYLFDSRTPHRFRNRTDQPTVVISACTPPYL